MSVFKVHIENRYSQWTVYKDKSFEEVNDLNIDPAEEHLFSDDVFTNNDNVIKIIHSTVRNVKNIPAVLILDKNKTYGRKGKKLLYKCIPDDSRLPYFIVPYEMKQIGFNKNFENKYVTIKYESWDDKHPFGVISNLIGDVGKLEHYYTYQLYCKSLHASIQEFTRDTAKVLRERTEQEYISTILKKYDKIENQIDEDFVFTIDPSTSTDYDDAMSIKQISHDKFVLKIYISNVTVWMDVLNLWDKFSERISTIYLPDRKRPMLPTSLSDCLCSLQENSTRFAFMSEYVIENGDIVSINYKNVAIRVKKNYSYDSPQLLGNKDYHVIYDVVSKMNDKYKYVKNIDNSHDVVAYLMILMNFNTSQELIKNKNGIYRSVALKNSDEVSIPDHVSDSANKFLKIWSSAAGQYVEYSDDIRHELLDLDNYIHITSPIRRLVDLLNIIIFQKNNEMIDLTPGANEFLQKWINNLSYINVTMRAIRKVQCDCSLLHKCITDPCIMEKEYDGYLFDKLDRNDGLFQFMVYLPEINMASRITLRDGYVNYQCCKFKLYLFNNENKFKKKIRLNILV